MPAHCEARSSLKNGARETQMIIAMTCKIPSSIVWMAKGGQPRAEEYRSGGIVLSGNPKATTGMMCTTNCISCTKHNEWMLHLKRINKPATTIHAHTMSKAKTNVACMQTCNYVSRIRCMSCIYFILAYYFYLEAANILIIQLHTAASMSWGPLNGFSPA